MKSLGYVYPKYHSSERNSFLPLAFLKGFFLFSLSFSSCAAQSKPDSSIPFVETTPLVAEDISLWLSALGTVTPLYTVTLKTQVNGVLKSIFCEEGQKVDKGDLIAEIDSRPYEALLKQYKGQFLRDQALLSNAKADLKRYKGLFPQHSVSKQTVDTQAALVQQLEGTLKADEGLLEAAQVNLSFCQIKAPFSGRVGLRLIDPGNVVQTTDTTGIIVLNAMDPLSIVFQIPEDNLPQILHSSKTQKTLKVEAFDRWSRKLVGKGQVMAMDNQIDPSTGTIKIKSLFHNEGDNLFPNQFVNIKLYTDVLHQVPTLPESALQQGSQGPYVYILTDHQKIQVKPVKVLALLNHKAVLSSDIPLGTQVVIEGTDKIYDGAPAQRSEKSSKSPERSLTPHGEKQVQSGEETSISHERKSTPS